MQDIITQLFTISGYLAQVNFDHCNIVNNPMSALDNIGPAISGVIALLRNLAILLGMLFMVIGGITLVTSQGNPDKVNQGKQTLTWAIAAIVITVLLWSALLVLANFAGIKGFGQDGIKFERFEYDKTDVKC
jgi:hypothetical protein